MKTPLSTFLSLTATLQSTNLAYLFGSGMSSALTGAYYGWVQWIQDGIQLINDSALRSTLSDSLKHDNSADNCIRVVGIVIAELRKSGRYDTWMQGTIEHQKIHEMDMAKTLSKIPLTRDIILTTNYDHLLEDATGLSLVTYHQPDRIFKMIQSGLSTAVVHLHGAYYSPDGVDDIIADQIQYDAVFANEGAQFIQNLLSTRALILVGCGQTVEDENIAHFIQFARTALKLDIPYFYLYREGDVLPKLPDGVDCVCYGAEYGDLPGFMSDMVTMRMEEFMKNHPIIGRVYGEERYADPFHLAEYHFASEEIPFCGRISELGQLITFAENDRPAAWWALTGQAGAGKSRLAYEFMKRIFGKYYAFFLNGSVDAALVKKFQPFSDTFVIVDYVYGNERNLAAILHELLLLFKGSDYKLRILFVERSRETVQGSWYHTLLQHMSVYDRGEFQGLEYQYDSLMRTHGFLYLEDLEEAAVVELIGHICALYGLGADRGRDQRLMEEYAAKFEQLKFRPLFLQMFVEAWIGNDCIQVSYKDFNELLELCLQREQKNWLTLVDGDTKAAAALIRLLVRASASDGIELAMIPEMYQQDWKLVKESLTHGAMPGKQKNVQLQQLLTEAGNALVSSDRIISPKYPDIFKEFMFLYYLDDENRADVCRELWNTCAEPFSVFLYRAVMDFPGDKTLRTLVRDSAAGLDPYALQARLALLRNEVVRPDDDIRDLQQVVTEESAFWKGVKWEKLQSREQKEAVLHGLYFSSLQLRGWQRIEESMDAVDELIVRADDPELTETALQLVCDRMETLTDECLNYHGYIYPERIWEHVRQRAKGGRFKWSKAMRYRFLRNHIVALYGSHKEDEALKLLETMRQKTDLSQIEQLEIYAYTVYSLAELSHIDYTNNQLMTFCDMLQDLVVEIAENQTRYHMNDQIHYYYLKTKFYDVQRSSILGIMSGMPIGRTMALSSIRGLIEEIEANEMINEFSGIHIGALALRVADDDTVTDEETRDYIKLAFTYADQYADNRFLCKQIMELLEAAYTEQFHLPIPEEYVSRCYTLLLRFPDDKELLEEFFGPLLDDAAVSDKKKYLNRKSIISGLTKHRLFDVILKIESGIGTVRTAGKKVGRNDPCPCGSGKKYKKCCGR